MNVETGQVYRGEEAIRQALGRGEPVVEVSETVAGLLEAGRQHRALDPFVLSLAQRVAALEERAKLEDAKERLEALGIVIADKVPGGMP